MANVNPIQVQKFLKGVDYPVSKEDPFKQAEQNGADKNIRETLQHLPDQQFDSPTDVTKALGKIE
jgi:hypothetical protein